MANQEAASLYIHVFEDISEAKLRVFWNQRDSLFLGLRGERNWEEWASAAETVSKTPNIWIGEVPGIAAAAREAHERDADVPATVARIDALLGDDRLPNLTPELAGQIADALSLPNTTEYAVTDRRDELHDFLQAHMGKRVFAVSW